MTSRERRVKQAKTIMLGNGSVRYFVEGAHPMSNMPVNRRTAERRVADDKRGLLQDLIESHRECGCDTVREIVEACRRPECDEIIPEAKHTEDCPWGWIVGEK